MKNSENIESMRMEMSKQQECIELQQGKKMTFDEQYEFYRPLRNEACERYYSMRVKYKSLNDAENKGLKGHWVCLVTQPNGTTFYVTHYFTQKWLYVGCVIGMWNELTLIEKIK
jgi:hypothetical protein